MPNWVTTQLAVTGLVPDPAEVSRFKQEILTPHFDFNKIIPKPPEVEGTESGTNAWEGLWAHRGVDGSSGRKTPVPVSWDKHWAEESWVGNRPPEGVTDRAQYLVWLQSNKPAVYDAGLVAARCYDLTGYADWYGWCVHHWGTKWNATETELLWHDVPGGTLGVKIVTAWDFPLPIFTKLVQMFPSLVFTTSTFDEGWNFASQGVFSSGVTVYDEFNPYEERKRGVLLYRTVYGELPEDSDLYLRDRPQT